MFDDASKQRFVDSISQMLEVQVVASGGGSLEDAVSGDINSKAIGYIYGFVDAALRGVGQDMSDVSIGIPITFQILNGLWPGRAEHYVDYLAGHMGSDHQVTVGAMVGGQQYIDFMNRKLAAPMGLARFIVEQR